MARSKGNIQPGNIDSLLDTITNVVGVLIIIMAVCQVLVLGRLRQTDTPEEKITPITPDTIALREDELERLRTTMNEVRERWGVFEVKQRRHSVEIKDLEETIRHLNEAIANSAAIDANLAATRSKQADLDERRTELSRQLEDTQEETAKLEKQLGSSTVTEISLPETRYVDRDLKATTYVCRRGQVFPLRFEDLSKSFTRAIQTVAASIRPTMSLAERIRRTIDYFDENVVGDDNFRLELLAYMPANQFRGFVIRTNLRPGARGETIEDLANGNSRFLATVRAIDPDTQYLKFDVWSDSFDLYLTAQRVAEEAHAGGDRMHTRIGLSWVPYAEDEEIQELWNPTESSSADTSPNESKRTRITNF